jgi:hypothetical protein
MNPLENPMKRFGALAMLAATIVVSEVSAAQHVSPYLVGHFGLSHLATRISVQTSPPTTNEYWSDDANLLLSLNAGLRVGPLGLDLMGRRELGGTPFRVATAGTLVRFGPEGRVQLRGGIGRVGAYQPVTCANSLGGSCPRYADEWQDGFDLSATISMWRVGRAMIGPSAWWVQTTTGNTLYRVRGIGVQARVP